MAANNLQLLDSFIQTVQYVQGIFVEKYDPTIEDSYRKQVKVDGQHCMLEILDTAGTVSVCIIAIVYESSTPCQLKYLILKMQFGAMRDLYIKNGRGFALVYSITSRLTFIDLKEHRDHVTKIKDTDDVMHAMHYLLFYTDGTIL